MHRNRLMTAKQMETLAQEYLECADKYCGCPDELCGVCEFVKRSGIGCKYCGSIDCDCHEYEEEDGPERK